MAECPGPWATPFCPFLAKTGGSRWDYLSRLLFSSSSIQTVYMGLSTGVLFSGTINTTYAGKSGEYFSTGSTRPQIRAHHLSARPKSHSVASKQQDVQPFLAHPATTPPLVGINALRRASVGSHGSNALYCCAYRSCDTFPTISGAHATNFESRIMFFRACSRRWPTYLQYRSHAHTAGPLSTAPPTTAQHD